MMKEKAGEPVRNLVILVCTVRDHQGLLEGVSRELMGLSDLGSSGKTAFEES